MNSRGRQQVDEAEKCVNNKLGKEQQQIAQPQTQGVSYASVKEQQQVRHNRQLQPESTGTPAPHRRQAVL